MTSKTLVIVESPAKAKTISQFLGKDYQVLASVGHVVDLPSSGLCVDVEDDFRLTYEVTKKDVIRQLKEALTRANQLFLATDEDREGEAIAWHLMEQLKPKVPTRRMVFHEITRKAIEHAVANSRDIDQGLVDAQETRRALDRLYGYEVSPVLWRKVKTGLSAGRVQSPAIRLIVERERERMSFRSASYWDIVAEHPTTPAFSSTLQRIGGKRIATGRDFNQKGELTNKEALLLDEKAARGLAESMAGRSLTVAALERRPYRSSPKPPFMTSTLQQEGGRKLSMSAQQVMRVAQSLYESGYITYMRTDSTVLSQSALTAAREQIRERFGAESLPDAPRQYARKVKNAQEAHEAIRPAGERFRAPDEVAKELAPAQLKLYELIWRRTLASQMADAIGESLTVRLSGESPRKEQVEFVASGRTIHSPGHLRAYEEERDEATATEEDTVLPKFNVGDTVPVESLTPKGHETPPPPRYTEASLVKKLEELGIGRPSTYASIIGTLQAKYVWKKGQALIPNWEAFAVVALLEKHFQDLVDLAFTAELEEDLDKIAAGDREKVAFLKDFYFGSGSHPGLKSQVTQNLEKIDAAAINSISIGRDESGREVVVKPGRYGPYLRRGDDTVSVPEALPPDEVTIDKALELLRAPKSTEPIGKDPASGLPIYVKQGRFGPYVQLGDGDDDTKPKTQSLFKTMRPEEVTVEVALKLLTLPRTVGTAPDGEEVLAQNGRYGPYLSKGKETRNIDDEARLLTISLEEALALFKEPKQFGKRRTARPPLASLGNDPESQKPIVVKDGRFGPYVTDGETLASLRKGDEPSELTLERALELLQLRRDYLATPEAQERLARKGKGRRGGAKSAASAKKKAAPAKKSAPKRAAKKKA